MSNPEAEAKKELGNQAFAAKEYDDAIRHYTDAIALDSSNCVYFSNRSACYTGKKDWATAAKDAKDCIKTNPSFIKGYCRLANAQSQQHEFEAALSTIKQGFAIESENPLLQKQLRQIKEEQLFCDPPPREACPICFLPLPWDDAETTYEACCGKVVCFGCTFASGLKQPDLLMPPCSFCDTPAAANEREATERLNKRMEQNDAEAFRDRACAYELGEGGMPRDEVKAFQHFVRSAELGSVEAHNNLGNSYKNGRGVAVDMKKAKHHYQLGAIGGNAIARNNLGVMEAVAGKFPMAMRHLKITASQGFVTVGLKMGFEQGYISKEDYEKTMEAHQDAVNKMKSEERDAAAIVAPGRGRIYGGR